MRFGLAKGVLITAVGGALVLLCGFGVQPAKRQAVEQVGVAVIVTAAPVYEPGAKEERFPKGAHLLMLKAGKAEPLLPEFYATADANVSFDGKTVLFAGRRESIDPWQIWELKFSDNTLKQVVTGDEDLIRPMYLPGWRLLYARKTEHGYEMEAAFQDGTARLALTHVGTATEPVNAIPADVMMDGRVLFESGFPLGTSGARELYLVYSDGSGVESYRCDHPGGNAGRWGGKQLASGDVIFTHGTRLGKFTSPLAEEAAVSAAAAEYAGGLAELESGSWLVSARRTADKSYGLNLMRAGVSGLQKVYSEDGQNLVEPVLVAPRTTPKRHPTALHDWTTANMLALDVRISRDGGLKEVPTQVRLEQQEADGRVAALGTAPVEADGSFYVKTPGDRAVRFTLLDKNGTAIRAEHGWFWIRKGEQRICVGCHAGPERAPENAVPQVLLRTIIPADLSGTAASGTAKAATGGH